MNVGIFLYIISRHEIICEKIHQLRCEKHGTFFELSLSERQYLYKTLKSTVWEVKCPKKIWNNTNIINVNCNFRYTYDWRSITVVSDVVEQCRTRYEWNVTYAGMNVFPVCWRSNISAYLYKCPWSFILESIDFAKVV